MEHTHREVRFEETFMYVTYKDDNAVTREYKYTCKKHQGDDKYWALRRFSNQKGGGLYTCIQVRAGWCVGWGGLGREGRQSKPQTGPCWFVKGEVGASEQTPALHMHTGLWGKDTVKYRCVASVCVCVCECVCVRSVLQNAPGVRTPCCAG